MKAFLMVMLVLCAGASAFGASGSTAQQLKSNKTLISLADAKSRIDKAIASPTVAKAIMQHLSAPDQKAFLAELNTAIKAMPASEGERVEVFVAVNRAAIEGAQKGNVATLVAESFATVSPNALSALSESLGKDLMNRATDPGRTYTDEQYVKIGQIVMSKVNERTAETDHGDVRSGFAALMFIRGSNTPEGEIVDAFAEMLPAEVRQTAKTEWFPAALAEGADQNYDAMLAAADVEPVEEVAARSEAETTRGGSEGAADGAVNGNLSGIINLRVAGPQFGDSLISDIAGANTDPALNTASANPVYDAVTAPIQYQLPNLGAGEASADTAATVEEAHDYQWGTRK